MRMTNLTIQRRNGNTGGYTTIAQHLPVQVDQSSMREVVDARQLYTFRSSDLWHIDTVYKPPYPVQRGDRLVDELTNDPETGKPFVYIVLSRPKDYDDHQEFLCDTVIGS